MISGYRCEVDENCALLDYYAESSGNFLLTFRDNLSGPIFRGQEENFLTLNMGKTVCPEMSVRNYHCTLSNIPEQRSSHKTELYLKFRIIT